MNWYKIAQSVDSFYALGLPHPVAYTLHLIKQLVDTAEKSRKEKIRAIENLLGYEKVLKNFRPGSYGFHSNVIGKDIPEKVKEFINWTHSMLYRLQMSINNPHLYNNNLILVTWRYRELMNDPGFVTKPS